MRDSDGDDRLLQDFGELKRNISLELSLAQKKILDRAIRAFNTNPKRGIRYMFKELEIISDLQSLGTFLAQVHGLDKNMLGEWLGDHHEENMKTLDHFSNAFPFEDKTFDQSLRLFLSSFKLPGEAQKIDRVTFAFAKAYFKKNPSIYSNVDVVHIMTFGAILLNTDAHCPGIKNRMTLQEFISNNRGIDSGNDIPRDILEGIYSGIVNNEIVTTEDRSDHGNLFTYPIKEGWLSKKGGLTKQSFQKRWFILCENTLFYFRNEDDIDPRGFFPLIGNANAVQSPKNPRQVLLQPTTLGDHLKSAKFNSSREIVPGKHKQATLLAASAEEAKEWTRVINISTEEPTEEAQGKIGNPKPLRELKATKIRESRILRNSQIFYKDDQNKADTNSQASDQLDDLDPITQPIDNRGDHDDEKSCMAHFSDYVDCYNQNKIQAQEKTK